MGVSEKHGRLTASRLPYEQASFEKLLRNAGISNDSTVALYGDNNNWFAAWGAWIFDVNNVKNVKLLDGRRKKWEAEYCSLTPDAAQVAGGNIKIGAPNKALRAGASLLDRQMRKLNSAPEPFHTELFLFEALHRLE